MTVHQRNFGRFAAMSGVVFLAIVLLLATDHQGKLTANAAQQPTAAPTNATPVAQNLAVPLFGLFETTLPIQATAKNNYNPDEIDIKVQFVGPDGATATIPAFWMQPYTQNCTKDCTVEVLKPEGQAGWRVRFSPNKVGSWTYIVSERTPQGTKNTLRGTFAVTASKLPGFVRVGQNHRYFGYDSGMPYFPVGSNLGWSWSGANGTLGYQNWLKKLHEVGANYGRLFIDVPWFIGLEWKPPVGDYTAAQEDSWRLDTILQTAQEQGIALEIVLVWAQGFTTYGGLPVNAPTTPGRPDTSADWTKNPYSTGLGGPFSGPAQFFATDPGRSLFKRRLRYIVARWGYSTSIFAWNVIDQLDRASVTSSDSASDWLKESVNYLRDIDPYKHLITAGLRDSKNAVLLDRAVLDFKEVRFYQRRPIETAVDQVSGVMNALSTTLGSADRPVLLSEFSLGPWFEPTGDDPSGIHVRETMWATALSGAAGSGATWWWDTYVFPQNLTSIFSPLAAFSRDIPWNTSNIVPIGVALMGGTPADYAPLRIVGYQGTYGGPKAPDVTFRVTPDGAVPPVSTTSSYLYGVTFSTQLSQPQKYVISPPVDTTLTVTVRRVSEKSTARLVITIDGKLAASMFLSPHSEPAALTVPIRAGEHNVVIDNLGPDFLQLDSMELAQYITPLRTLAVADRKQGIFLAWIQHRDYTWENALKGIEAKPVSINLRVDGMPPGQYRVELWDPFTGNVVGNETMTIPGVKPGNLSVNLLPISKMLAVRAIRIAEPSNPPASTATLTPSPRPIVTVTPTAGQ